jgi:hypothetical protein
MTALFARKGEPPSAVHWYVESCADAIEAARRRKRVLTGS